MTTISPTAFLAEYVNPAVHLYGQNRLEKHLAVHAISQMDNLAEMVAIHQLPPGRTELDRGEANAYRGDLRTRWPILGMIHDAHDCHKHEKLSRASAKVPQGIASGRPEQATEYGFFLDHTFLDGPLTPFEVLVVTLNDGTQREVCGLLFEAQKAWEAEFQRLGLV